MFAVYKKAFHMTTGWIPARNAVGFFHIGNVRCDDFYLEFLIVFVLWHLRAPKNKKAGLIAHLEI